MAKNIRVLVVDDSLVCREMLASMLAQADDIEVVAKASNGKEAIVLNRSLRPDLITMDVQMPGISGFEAIEEIMAHQPTPILVVTSSPVREGIDQTFRALSAGALDLIQKPEIGEEGSEDLGKKVRLLAGVKVIQRRRRPSRPAPISPGPGLQKRRTIISIAASTGGPKLLLEMFSRLPRDYPGCILLTQHLPAGFSTGFADWLNSQLAIEVAEAQNGTQLRPGQIFVAPSHHHLTVRRDNTMALSSAPPVHSHRPSATPMFQSLAQTFPHRAMGLILSGMGRDGADGMVELHQAGGLCFAQDEASCLVFGMPRVAIELGAVDQVLDVAGLTKILLSCGAQLP